MMTCRDCIHWKACKSMLEVQGYSVNNDFQGDAQRCDTFENKAEYTEVKKAKWLRHKYEGDKHESCECSNCKTIYKYPVTACLLNFCPKCGYDMREE